MSIMFFTGGVNFAGFPGGPGFWKDGVHGNEEDDEAVPC